MEIMPKQPSAKGPAEWFTGDVWIDAIARGQEPSRVSVSAVRFTPGARTAWHSQGNFIGGAIGSAAAAELWSVGKWTAVTIAGAALSCFGLVVWAIGRRSALVVARRDSRDGP